jgi:hypothetical protein
MNLAKMLHILNQGQDVPQSFIDRANALLATLTGEDHSALAAAIKRVTDQQQPEKPDTKAK